MWLPRWFAWRSLPVGDCRGWVDVELADEFAGGCVEMRT